MLTLEKVVAGLGSAGSSCHKDIYKAARQAMTDRSMAVRCAAAKVSNFYLFMTYSFLYRLHIIRKCLPYLAQELSLHHYCPLARGQDKWIHAFPKGISMK